MTVTDWPLAPKTGYYNIDGKRIWLEAEEPFPETAPPKKEWVGLTDEEILEEILGSRMVMMGT
jgi:hypothetical protein